MCFPIPPWVCKWNGGFSKCCRPKSPTKMIQSGSSEPAPSQHVSLTNESIKRIIHNAVNGLKIGLNNELSTLSTSINNLSTKVDVVTVKVDEVINNVADHSQRIAVIEGTLKDLNQSTITQNCMHEIYDRLSRSCNLILFGLSNDLNNQVDTLNTVSQLFLKFCKPDLLDNLQLFRLCTFMQDQTRSRPVKISCHTVERAKDIYRSFLSAKKSDLHSPHLENTRLSCFHLTFLFLPRRG